jgi:hypothetical protein
MIQDGHTGWLTDQATSEQLAQTLRRALETPPDVMAEMGRQASDDIEQICGPGVVLEKQIKFRNRIAQHPATRSLYSPTSNSELPRSGGRDGMPEILAERPDWLSSSLVNPRKRRTQKSSLKLIDIFTLALENPAFFFEKAVWAIMQLRKKFQAQEK